MIVDSPDLITMESRKSKGWTDCASDGCTRAATHAVVIEGESLRVCKRCFRFLKVYYGGARRDRFKSVNWV